jgi:UDP-N-acetylglucosamine diphosphorylase / glucose-1-phosphate thymidylyltransferase / UDP-N-acetylgalactosamine diphosphorylase / glucosamine-1-phosphate N-acetyltransferase / galactosamine-1-phosphate N-acetyltransferase
MRRLATSQSAAPNPRKIRTFVSIEESRKSEDLVAHFDNHATLFEALADLQTLASRLTARWGRRGEGSFVSDRAIIGDGVFIGAGVQIHEFSTVRDHSVLLDSVVVGHGCEVGRTLVCDGTTLGHKISVCDSIFGLNCSIAAQVTCACINLQPHGRRRTPSRVRVQLGDGAILATGLAKFGCILGDESQVGMHVGLSPGALVGRDSIVYPMTLVENWYYPPGADIR